ncbi:MarR family transcriptional regulator [Fictibacillus macauensis ZFHKF-1]|uniref:HTH-type transcriptional regulator SarZ n=1 Tax=Fictibacillus macauensis ZFHKF-1 TaxID=1196324 RepID=I8AF94_9BACL|nr:MarR family transcriptional regulator [Fictibacillus macauensis]EIT84302.1 MarR family transcriptional regulator [Fictibacillus macauensis ZFHKF-1]
MDVKELNRYWTDIYYYLHVAHKEKLTHHMVRIMQMIEKEAEVSVRSVAERLAISHNTASEHVKRLLEKAYITKRRSERDERIVFLQLTSLGEDVLYRHTSLDEERLQHVINSYSEEERTMIQHALKRLSEGAKACSSY